MDKTGQNPFVSLGQNPSPFRGERGVLSIQVLAYLKTIDSKTSP